MNTDNLGAILRGAIKERGYTQEEFAEEAGVGLASLKKYMSGAVCYDVAALDRFSDVLKCSYDYLLGKTEAPEPEHKTVKDLTKLAGGSIERLLEAARDDDELKIKVIDYLIQNDKLIDCARDYIAFQLYEKECDEPEDERYIMLNDMGNRVDSVRLGDYRLCAPELAPAYLAGMMTSFIGNLGNFGGSLPLRRYYFKGQKDKNRGDNEA